MAATLYDDKLPTYMDIAMGYGANNEILPLVNTLSQTNDILLDAVPVECNSGFSHKFSTMLKEPEFYIRRFNMGTPASGIQMGNAQESCAMFEGLAQCDAKLLKMQKNRSDYLFKRDKQFLNKFNKDMATMLWYSSVADDPGMFNGFAVRYGKKTGPFKEQILDAGGTKTNGLTSIWLIVWNDTAVHTLYPEGSTLGLNKQDEGIIQITQISEDNRTLVLPVQQTRFEWNLGLAIEDPRYVVRICNIDVKDLQTGANTQAPEAQTNIVRLMIDAMNRVFNLSDGRAAFYMNRIVYSALQKQGLNFSGNVVKFIEAVSQFSQPGSVGKTFGSFCGVPMRRVDALRTNEEKVI